MGSGKIALMLEKNKRQLTAKENDQNSSNTVISSCATKDKFPKENIKTNTYIEHKKKNEKIKSRGKHTTSSKSTFRNNSTSQDDNSPTFSKEVKHNFQLKRYPLTFISVIKCTFKCAIGFPAFALNAFIAFLLCHLVNAIPMPIIWNKTLQRTLKSYVEKVCTTVVGLWFSKEMYISLDEKMANLLSKLEDQNENPCLLTISNHVSEFDWLFLSKLADNLNFFRYSNFIAKNELTQVPIVGYLMKSAGHTFMMRQRSNDPNVRSSDIMAINTFAGGLIEEYTCGRRIQNSLSNWFTRKISCILEKLKIIKKTPGSNGLYFPEATIFEDSTYSTTLEFFDKTDEYSKKNLDLFRPNYVLLPRPLGTAALLSKLVDHLHCICNTTLLTNPFVSSTYNCYSYADILTCRAQPFAFGVLVDFLEIPEEIKKSIAKLDKKSPNFEFTQKLSNDEIEVKNVVSRFLNKTYKKKDTIIQKYVEGESKGNFKNIEEFNKFIKTIDTSNKRISYRLKLDSKYNIPILISPFVLAILCIFLVKQLF